VNLRIYRICNEPEFFGDCEHVFVEGANLYFIFAVFFAYIKNGGYVNGIEAFTFGKHIIIAMHGIFKKFVNISVKNIVQKFIEILQSCCKPFTINFISYISVISSQNNVCFKSEKNGANSDIIVPPNSKSLLCSRFIHQNCEQDRRVEIINHKLKSIRATIFVVSPPIFVFYFGFCVKPSRSFYLFRTSFRQASPASLCFFNHPFNEISLLFVINRVHHSVAEVYNSMVRLFGCPDFGFCGCGSLHSSNIQNEFKEAA